MMMDVFNDKVLGDGVPSAFKLQIWGCAKSCRRHS